MMENVINLNLLIVRNLGSIVLQGVEKDFNVVDLRLLSADVMDKIKPNFDKIYTMIQQFGFRCKDFASSSADNEAFLDKKNILIVLKEILKRLST